MENKKRTLSEEFFTRSPNTQAYIKSMVMTIPTSKPRFSHDSASLEMYNQASPTTKTSMEAYGLVPLNIIRMRFFGKK